MVLTLATGHGQSVTCASWSHCGKLLITSSDDRTANVWAVGSLDPIMTLSNSVHNLAAAATATAQPSDKVSLHSTLKIIGLTITTNGLSMAEHVHGVISSCSQTFYALRVLRAHVMLASALREVSERWSLPNCAMYPVLGGVSPRLGTISE